MRARMAGKVKMISGNIEGKWMRRDGTEQKSEDW